MAALGPLRCALRSGTIAGLLILATTFPAWAAGPPEPGNAPAQEVVAGKGDGDLEGEVRALPTPADVERIIESTLSPADLRSLVGDAARGAITESDARVRALGAGLDLRQEALARMLEILGRQNVPPERLADVLAEIVARHKVLLARVRLLEAPDPRTAELRAGLAAALEAAEYDRVDRLLAEAEAAGLEATHRILKAPEQRVMNAVAADGRSGDIPARQLGFGRSAEHGALLHGDGQADSEGVRRFVASERVCRRRPEHPLCARWAESSRLCDRRPDHPVCERFCNKNRSHPLCADDPPPSDS